MAGAPAPSAPPVNDEDGDGAVAVLCPRHWKVPFVAAEVPVGDEEDGGLRYAGVVAFWTRYGSWRGEIRRQRIGSASQA